MLLNKKAESLIESTLSYVVIFALFMTIMLGFIYNQQNNSLLEGQKYAYHLAALIDSSKPGDFISYDIQKLSEFALKNEIKDWQSLITFDNVNQLVFVKTNNGVIVNYPYLKSYEIVDVSYSLTNDRNTINFKVGNKNE